MKRKRRKCRRCKGQLNLIGECLLCEMFRTGQTPRGMHPTQWPHRSKALACHPKQVAEMNARNRKYGSAAYYEPDGTCVMPDPGAKRSVLKIEKAHDEEATFGAT